MSTWVQMTKNASSPDYSLLAGQVALLSDADATALAAADAATTLTSTAALALQAMNGGAGPAVKDADYD
jgi:hypothetical protein